MSANRAKRAKWEKLRENEENFMEVLIKVLITVNVMTCVLFDELTQLQLAFQGSQR